MDTKVLDAFVDDATHAVADRWTNVSGDVLRIEDMYALNELLTSFFSSLNEINPKS